ncbi:hypothetical protein PR048_026852 [Dryococelus australis]|uniref:Uncharacterized protein n=1 Tax=Dryococelus australis TaxID=614101 RepID=A0ABQ9GMI6_9NEOP|nr:hypothetical protein PR048_026852 [Dryococelus australis]
MHQREEKNVLMISTMHNSDPIDESTGDMCKSEIITFYNLTKGGVDVVDEMKVSYSMSSINHYTYVKTLVFGSDETSSSDKSCHAHSFRTAGKPNHTGFWIASCGKSTTTN